MDAFATAQGQSVGFYIVFLGAIVAFVSLSIVVITKVVRKDKAARKLWVQRQTDETGGGGDVTA